MSNNLFGENIFIEEEEEEEEDKKLSFFEYLMDNIYIRYSIFIFSGILLIILLYYTYNFFVGKKNYLEESRKDNIKKYPPIENVLDFTKAIVKQYDDSKIVMPEYFNKHKISKIPDNNISYYHNKYDTRTFVQGADGKFYHNIKI